MIYHIYWGTSGNSGLYLDEIYQTLKASNFNQRAFVNYYYPFDYGDKIFFRYGDVANSKFKGTTRKIIQLIEVLLCYTKIFFCSLVQRPNLINYSHVGQSYIFIYWFLIMLKFFSGAKLVVTCHDVLPFGKKKCEMANRKKIFLSADFLLVHTHNSKIELESYFGIAESKIVYHLFPIMDLSKLTKIEGNKEKNIDFLFIGHLRKEKGVDFLLDSWKEFNKLNKTARLRICGKKLPSNTFDENELSKYNIDFDLRFIPDDDYYDLVRRAKYVLLPYTKGTNSGIISTVLSLGTAVITSDIPMFKENPLVPNDCMFKTENVESFVDILQKKWCVNPPTISTLKEYRQIFNEEVCEVYSKLTI